MATWTVRSLETYTVESTVDAETEQEAIEKWHAGQAEELGREPYNSKVESVEFYED
jgi:hypothetical protein